MRGDRFTRRSGKLVNLSRERRCMSHAIKICFKKTRQRMASGAWFEDQPSFEEMYPEDALRGRCHKCGGDIHKPPEKECDIDHEGQAELAYRYYEEGDDPESHRCHTCSAIYDGGMRCTYCGDPDPEDTGEFEEDDL